MLENVSYQQQRGTLWDTPGKSLGRDRGCHIELSKAPSMVRTGELGPWVSGFQPGLQLGQDKQPSTQASQGHPLWSLGSQHVTVPV